MKSGEAEGRLRTLLLEAGVDLEHPSAADVTTTWEVIARFAGEPVEDADPPDQDGDGVLAQYGTYDWGDGEHFELDMTRQFTFSERGEYDHMAQLRCTFRFEPTDDLRAAGADMLWSFGLPLDEFLDRALSMPGFTAVKDRAPAGALIEYGDV